MSISKERATVLLLHYEKHADKNTSMFDKTNYQITGKMYLSCGETCLNISLAEDEVLVPTGKKWKISAEVLERTGYVAWKHFIPEWAFEILNGGNHFKFRQVSAFTDFDVESMGDIFEYISKYRPIIGVYGNCQSIVISKIMQNTEVLKKRYMFCEFPFVQDMQIEAETGFHKEYMKFFSIFIYQNVSEKNNYGKKLATEECVLAALDQDCKRISVPFVYFKGYFPQYIKNRREGGKGLCPYGDIKLQTLCLNGETTQIMVKTVTSDEPFTGEELRQNIEESAMELRQREERCDIKILDYILENYQSKYLFYSPNHPTNICLKELVRRILMHLGFQNYSMELEGVLKSDIIKCCIYPCVYKKLGLSFEQEHIRFHKALGDEDTIERYVEKYVEYNFPELDSYLMQNFRTIDVRELLHLREDKVSERMKGFFTISGRMLHMSMYLTVEAEVLNGVIMTIEQKQYAPKYGHIAVLSTVPDGRSVPLFLNNEGEFRVNSGMKKGTALVLDTSWTMS